ncbi:MAG: c-type cytochrome [Lutibacter sp.]|nr:c-type cytochrome [Lutibacter sp.]
MYKLLLKAKNLKTIFLVLATLVFISCDEKKQEPSANTIAAIVTSQNQSEGYILMKNNCYACHSVTSKSHDEIIAPPMAAIKRRYKMSYNSKEEFVNAFTDWALNPTKENALMRGAVMQFNVMPKQAFKKEDLEKIAAYIYDNELEKPDWFEKHFTDEHPNGMGKGMGRGKIQQF